MRTVARRLGAVLLLSAILAGCGAAQGSPSPSGPGTPAAPGSSATVLPSTPSGSEDPAVATARDYLTALAAGDTATAEAMEDATMRAAAPASALATLWSQIEAQFGAFGGLGEATTADAAPFTNVTVAASFAKAVVPLIVTIASDGTVAGLHLGAPKPVASGAPTPAPSPSPAAYVDPSRFRETEVTVGAAPWALPGTLAMPVGSGPFPAVVLVAGSGPNDRDETIGPNAPFRDIAQGLASMGVASLRYDKRTKVYASQMAADAANITVRQEVTDDAEAAVALLRATKGVDPARVAVVGHSLGAYLAPRIAAEVPGELAGIALLEAPSRPLADEIVSQFEYLASAEGGADPQASAALDAIRAQAALAMSPSLAPTTPAAELPLGIPAAYWLDLQAYDPVRTAAALSIPIFIAQGGRDYQVPPTDLAAWRAGLAGRTDVSIHEYPALNHLLIAGTGPSRPAEYAVPGHVDAGLVADLAAWAASL